MKSLYKWLLALFVFLFLIMIFFHSFLVEVDFYNETEQLRQLRSGNALTSRILLALVGMNRLSPTNIYFVDSHTELSDLKVKRVEVYLVEQQQGRVFEEGNTETRETIVTQSAGYSYNVQDQTVMISLYLSPQVPRTNALSYQAFANEGFLTALLHLKYDRQDVPGFYKRMYKYIEIFNNFTPLVYKV